MKAVEKRVRELVRESILAEWKFIESVHANPESIVEGKRKSGRHLTEGDEMFWGRDLLQMKTSQILNELEVADMDLDEIGCPATSHARTSIDHAIGTIEKVRERPVYYASMAIPFVNKAIEAIRECEEILPEMRPEALRIASNLQSALESYR